MVRPPVKKARTPNASQLRSASSRKALVERGGRLVQVSLEPETVAALEAIRSARGLTTDKAAIEAAITDARYVLDLLVRLDKDEAEALAYIRQEIGAASDRDAVGEALKAAARGLRARQKRPV